MKTPFDSTKPLNRSARRALRRHAKAANVNKRMDAMIHAFNTSKVTFVFECGDDIWTQDYTVEDTVALAEGIDLGLSTMMPCEEHLAAAGRMVQEAVTERKHYTVCGKALIESLACWFAVTSERGPLLVTGRVETCWFIAGPCAHSPSRFLVRLDMEERPSAANDNSEEVR